MVIILGSSKIYLAIDHMMASVINNAIIRKTIVPSGNLT
jgi:hypothetical protein